MMDPDALRLAADLGGHLLVSASGSLLLVERTQAHGLPQVLVLGRTPADLAAPLAAIQAAQARGTALNLAALLPLPGCDLPQALDHHARRLGALVAALDAGLPWLADRPMLARRLPGRVFRAEPAPLPKTPMGPLEKAELKAFLPGWDKARRRGTFRCPPWEAVAEGVEADLWSGVPVPPGAVVRVPPLELPLATPLADGLRAALRTAMDTQIPVLPLPADPSALQALRRLTPEVAAYRGPARAWELAFERLAALPAPPHFCARC